MRFLFNILLLTFTSHGFCQQGAVASGGTSSGSGGTSDFSLGQIGYLNYSNDLWQISEGIQQPYEIYQTNSINEDYTVTISIGPNPSVDQLSIFSEVSDVEELNYSLVDMNGKIILHGNIIEPHHQLDLRALAPAQYILTLFNNYEPITVYKLIKNR